MPYSSLLFVIDMGFIGFITAVIVTVTVALARRERQIAESPATASNSQQKEGVLCLQK